MASNQEILTKAIQKAIDNGWSKTGLTNEGKTHFTENGIVVDLLRGGIDFTSTEAIIYNHDFAKALWGENQRAWYCNSDYMCTAKPIISEEPPSEECPECGWNGYKPTIIDIWKNHLQQMVIADDPIKYLGENI